MKKHSRRLYGYIALLLFISSCSIKQAAFKSVADMAAPPPGTKKTAVENNPIDALTGEDDIQLVSEVFPVILKTYEMMHLSDPRHRGLALMTGSLYVMYANVFVQTPADYIPETQFDKKNAGYLRAKKFYLRGARMVMDSLTLEYPLFSTIMSGVEENEIQTILSRCTKADVESLFWAGSGFLGAFALDPMDADCLQSVPAAVAMLERALELDPSFNEGALWEVLATFYAAAPEPMGGGMEKAQNAYKKALELSKGTRPSVHVLYAQSFCIPAQDREGFDAALEKALEINPEDQPKNKLTIALSQEKALWLKKNVDDYFL